MTETGDQASRQQGQDLADYNARNPILFSIHCDGRRSGSQHGPVNVAVVRVNRDTGTYLLLRHNEENQVIKPGQAARLLCPNCRREVLVGERMAASEPVQRVAAAAAETGGWPGSVSIAVLDEMANRGLL